MIGLMVFAQAEFKRGDNDVTVIDTDTKLEWQDSYKDDTIERYEWRDALTYCEDLSLDSKGDWRLPNINELKSIIVETQYAPAISEIFKYTKYIRSNQTHGYWSSTAEKEYSKSAYDKAKWIVDFNNGRIYTNEITDRYSTGFSYIRCVRDAD